MKDLVKRLTNLLTVKSIVTLVLTLVFAYITVVALVPVESFLAIFTMIMGFYFGTQKTKE